MEIKKPAYKQDPEWAKKKLARALVFKETLAKCKEKKITNVQTEKIWAHHGVIPNLTELRSKATGDCVIKVVNEDCVVVAQELSLSGRTCMLNMANAFTRGGGVVNGSMAQEEELCRRSNLYYGLRPSYYPIGDNNLIYSKNVKFFRNRDYKAMKTFKCDVITVAAPNLIGLLTLPPGYTNTVIEKTKQILALPYKYGCKNLVLSAFGCGAFRNDPVQIANYFALQLYDLPYDNIYFAIIDDQNSKANGKSNFNTFKEIIENI